MTCECFQELASAVNASTPSVSQFSFTDDVSLNLMAADGRALQPNDRKHLRDLVQPVIAKSLIDVSERLSVTELRSDEVR